MDRLQMAETLRQKAGVNYEEAQAALVQNDWDLLAAFIQLEKEGKIKNTRQETSGNAGKNEETQQAKQNETQQSKQSGPHKANWLEQAFNWGKNLVEKGNRNYFTISRDGRRMFDISVTVAVLAALLFHGLTFFVIVVGLIVGYRATFRSEEQVKKDRKDVADAEAAAEAINNHHTVNSFGEQRA